MMRTVAGLLITAATMYALACLVLFFSQRSLMFFPQPRGLGTQASLMKLQMEDLQLNVTTRQLKVPEAVIYFGGNAEDVSGSLPDLEAAFPAHALYLMHYRGYGGSEGKPGEEALVADALALFDQVRTQHPNVTVIGRSLGSGVAVHLASVRPVARLVLVTPYDSMVELAARQFPMFPVRWILTNKFESWRYAPQISVPTTLIAAENDAVIPRASTNLLLTRFKRGVARLVVIPSTGHNTVSNHPLYAQTLASPR